MLRWKRACETSSGHFYNVEANRKKKKKIDDKTLNWRCCIANTSGQSCESTKEKNKTKKKKSARFHLVTDGKFGFVTRREVAVRYNSRRRKRRRRCASQRRASIFGF
jgi:hypothetical protein